MLNDDALLKKYLVELALGDTLFRQNEKGNTMYIVLKGKVELVHTIQNQPRCVGVLGEGEILGEKAICGEGPFPRSCSAVAKTDASLLELGYEDLKVIQTKVPEFTLKILSLVTRRLEKANSLVSILQIPEETKRMGEYLVFLARHSGVPHPQGREIFTAPALVAATCNVPEAFATKCMEVLVRQKALISQGESYVLPDENAINQVLSEKVGRIAA